MPDLSLLQIISEELEISISELLSGRHMAGEERPKENETIEMIIDLVMKDKLKNRKQSVVLFQQLYAVL